MAEYTIDKFTYGGNTYKLQDNESGYLTAADVPEGSSASTITPANVAATPSKGTDNGFARGDHVHGITVTTGDSNGQVKIAGINTSVKGLGSAAYTASTAYLPSSTVVPTQTSQLQNNSGFLTSAVTSLNSKTGAVTISAGNNVTVSSTSNTITISATDTKNTAGATKTSSLIYLIGATATTTNPQSYTVTGNGLYYDNGLYSYSYHITGDSIIEQTYNNIKLTGNDAGWGITTTLTVSSSGVSLSGDNPKITGLITPSNDTDAVNKEYVDKRMGFSDTDDQVWVNWYGEETAIYGQQTQSVTYSFAVHMDDNKTKLTSATLARSYDGTDWDILGTLHPTSSFSNSFVPIGTILDFAGFTPPTGYLICDGRAISRTTYADLFEILKDENDNLPWGDGDGSTTFNLPNLCGRTVIGSGTGTASDATAHTLGSTGGAETHTLTPSETATKNHSHTYAKSKTSTDSHTLTTSEIPSHKHSVNERNSSGTSTGWAFMTENGKYAASGTRVVNTGGGGGHTHGIGTANATTTGNPTDANGNAHNNMQPYATVNKIIKAL